MQFEALLHIKAVMLGIIISVFLAPISIPYVYTGICGYAYVGLCLRVQINGTMYKGSEKEDMKPIARRKLKKLQVQVTGNWVN